MTFDARAEADAIVAAWNERDHAVVERLSDRLTAALQRAHDVGATGAQAKLEPAREALTKLLAMAQKPMKSWDSGWCIEAERVGEIAAEALEALA